MSHALRGPGIDSATATATTRTITIKQKKAKQKKHESQRAGIARVVG